MSTDIYYNKYLKYKNKYLILQQIINEQHAGVVAGLLNKTSPYISGFNVKANRLEMNTLTDEIVAINKQITEIKEQNKQRELQILDSSPSIMDHSDEAFKKAYDTLAKLKTDLQTKTERQAFLQQILAPIDTVSRAANAATRTIKNTANMLNKELHSLIHKSESILLSMELTNTNALLFVIIFLLKTYIDNASSFSSQLYNKISAATTLSQYDKVMHLINKINKINKDSIIEIITKNNNKLLSTITLDDLYNIFEIKKVQSQLTPLSN